MMASSVRACSSPRSSKSAPPCKSSVTGRAVRLDRPSPCAPSSPALSAGGTTVATPGPARFEAYKAARAADGTNALPSELAAGGGDALTAALEPTRLDAPPLGGAVALAAPAAPAAASGSMLPTAAPTLLVSAAAVAVAASSAAFRFAARRSCESPAPWLITTCCTECSGLIVADRTSFWSAMRSSNPCRSCGWIALSLLCSAIAAVTRFLASCTRTTFRPTILPAARATCKNSRRPRHA
mmetsp:Transcript_17417/g.55500  ORF Transcript_17417/g.55500 Transcript_17417/m.55500 type:complete len:240 (+) Transcript_17417:706-1425(+)